MYWLKYQISLRTTSTIFPKKNNTVPFIDSSNLFLFSVIAPSRVDILVSVVATLVL